MSAVCRCGKPIKPCPVSLAEAVPGVCRGYMHTETLAHACSDGELAEPREAA